MALSEKLSSDVIVTTLVNFSQKIRGIVFIPLITRLLGTASYGAFIQIEVIARMCSAIARLGLENALIKYSQERDGSRLYITLTSVTLVLGSVIAVNVFLTAESISRLFLSSTEYTALFQIGSLLVPIYIAQDMGQNYYRAEMRVKRFSVLEGLKTYLNVGTVIVVLFVMNGGLFEIVVAVTLVELVFALILQGTVLRSTGLHTPSISDIGPSVRYSIPIMVGDVSGMFQDRVDRLLLGIFIGANAVGIYSIAYSVAKLLRMYALPLRVTFFPEFSRLWEEGDQESCYQYLANGTRYLIGLAVPSVVGLYLIGEQLIGLLSTPEAAAYAPTLLPIIAAGIMLIGLDTLYRQLFFASGKTLLVSIIRVGASLLNIGLNVVLIPQMGVIGAALATLLTFIIGFSVLYGLTLRNYEIIVEWEFALKSLGAAVIMLGVAILSGIQSLILLLVLCPVVYFTVLIAIKGVHPHEARFILDLIRLSFT